LTKIEILFANKYNSYDTCYSSHTPFQNIMQILSLEIGEGNSKATILYQSRYYTIRFDQYDHMTVMHLINLFISLMLKNGVVFNASNITFHNNSGELDPKALLSSLEQSQIFIVVINIEACPADEEEHQNAHRGVYDEFGHIDGDFSEGEEEDYQDQYQYQDQEVDYLDGYGPDAYVNGHFVNQ
jgi:transcriptional antiterminator Rof (Rho-off)